MRDGTDLFGLPDHLTRQLNMAVHPAITYITGNSVITTDADGLEHTIDIFVGESHSLES